MMNGNLQLANRRHSSSSASRAVCRRRRRAGIGLFLAIGLALAATLILSGCFFRKRKAAVPHYTAPLRIALLPVNVPTENKDLNWVSLATPILMAKEMEAAADLETVPLWEGLPAALALLGPSRTLTEDIAVAAAGRVNARWVTQGEISPTQNGISILIDFMPRKGSQIPFRYAKECRTDSLSSHLREAIDQFLHYLVARPLAKRDRSGISLEPNRLRDLAEALDREYGWFASAEPGRGEKTFSGLASTDGRLARLLFNPAIYSVAATRPGVATAQTTVAAAPSTPSGAVSGPPSSAGAQRGSGSAQTAGADASTPTSSRTSTAPGLPSPAPPTPEARDTAPPNAPATTQTTPTPVSSTTSPPGASSRPTVTPTNPPKSARGATSSPPRENSVSAAPSKPLTYSIQVYSTRDKPKAEAQAVKLSKAGVRCEVVEVDLSEKGIWFRAVVTGYESREAASEAAKKLKESGLISEYLIIP